MKTLKLENHDTVTVIQLDNQVINAISMEMVEELARTLKDLQNDPNVKGIVIGSANEKFFSIGFNIPELFPMEKKQFIRFFSTFNRLCLELYTMPKPVVAALTGHAVAGGCVLALCCDYRIIAEGKKSLGLNEVKLGVPVPFLPDRILHSLVGQRAARDVLESGLFFMPDDSLRMGMVDQIVPVDQVLSESVKKCRALGDLPSAAYALIKKNRVDPVADEYRLKENETQELFCECWYSKQARTCLEEAMETFSK